jgi:hypothetical protein
VPAGGIEELDIVASGPCFAGAITVTIGTGPRTGTVVMLDDDRVVVVDAEQIDGRSDHCQIAVQNMAPVSDRGGELAHVCGVVRPEQRVEPDSVLQAVDLAGRGSISRGVGRRARDSRVEGDRDLRAGGQRRAQHLCCHAVSE